MKPDAAAVRGGGATVAYSADTLKLALHSHYANQQKPHRVFHEYLLGPAGNPRIDTWVLAVTWTRYTSFAFEVKVHRGDFLRDVQAGKWHSYLPHCSHFYFATPGGLVKPDEVPDPAGLVYVGDGERIRFAKRAVAREWKPDADVLLALLMSIETPRGRYHDGSYSARGGCRRAGDERLMSVREALRASRSLEAARAGKHHSRGVVRTLAEAGKVLERNKTKLEAAERAIALMRAMGAAIGGTGGFLPRGLGGWTPDDVFLAEIAKAVAETKEARAAVGKRDKLAAAHKALGELLGVEP